MFWGFIKTYVSIIIFIKYITAYIDITIYRLNSHQLLIFFFLMYCLFTDYQYSQLFTSAKLHNGSATTNSNAGCSGGVLCQVGRAGGPKLQGDYSIKYAEKPVYRRNKYRNRSLTLTQKVSIITFYMHQTGIILLTFQFKKYKIKRRKSLKCFG